MTSTLMPQYFVPDYSAELSINSGIDTINEISRRSDRLVDPGVLNQVADKCFFADFCDVDFGPVCNCGGL